MPVSLIEVCVAHYKMNDNAATTAIIDSQGNYNNAVAQQNTSALHTTGKVGGALTFNGTSDYIDTNASFQSVFQNSFSINFWVKFSALGQQQIVGVNSGVYPSNYSDVRVIFYDGTDLLFVYEDNIGQNISAWINNFTPNLNTWYMITVVVTKLSDTTAKADIYLKSTLGEESGTDSETINISNYTSIYNFYLGAFNNVGSLGVNPLNGSLDNVMIFNRALTTDEIAFLWNNGFGRETLIDKLCGDLIIGGQLVGGVAKKTRLTMDKIAVVERHTATISRAACP